MHIEAKVNKSVNLVLLMQVTTRVLHKFQDKITYVTHVRLYNYMIYLTLGS